MAAEPPVPLRESRGLLSAEEPPSRRRDVLPGPCRASGSGQYCHISGLLVKQSRPGALLPESNAGSNALLGR